MDPELVAKFIEVTGESEAIAQQYLALADNNVENAITLMFEGARAPEPPPIEPDPEVRPPILPMQDILVPSASVFSFPRVSNNVFDRFRDFAVETQRQEEEMTRRVTGMIQMSLRKSKRLEDLFRPPCHILFLGTFIEARDHAKTLNRWLLVNIQNSQEFACQVLNRDVWSNQQIQEIIKDHFVLWQVLSTTNDGKRYIDFYNVTEYPYLAIVDPRTGECMRAYNHITVDILMSALNDMLSNHPSPEGEPHPKLKEAPNSKEWNNCTMTTFKGSTVTDSTINDCSSSSSSKTSKHVIDSPNDSDSNSVTSNVSTASSNIPTSSFRATNKRRRVDESDLKEQCEEITTKVEQVPESKYEVDKSKCNETSVRLCLRLPSGKKETISMYATDTVEDFVSKMEDMGYAPSEHTYLVPFPKTNIGALPPEKHLSETILSPANTVFITKI